MVHSKVVVIPPGARTGAVRYDEAGRRAFRAEHGLAGKFVVMYSGNHSPCHPLDTLLGAAERLRDDARFVFCFIGGGSRFPAVRAFARERGLKNIVTMPYVAEERLSASLSAADLHAVVMGDAFVGIVHPSKIYNVLALGIPVLYVGPEESHVTELARAAGGEGWFYAARHGDVAGTVERILEAERCGRVRSAEELALAEGFSRERILERLTAAVLGLAAERAAEVEAVVAPASG